MIASIVLVPGIVTLQLRLVTLPKDLGCLFMILLMFERRCEGPMHQSG